MHILYVDMSGSLGNEKDSHFVMAGVAVKESGIYHVIKELDDIVAQSPLKIPKDMELHGVEILRGKKFWRSKFPAERIEFYKQCLSVFHGPSKNNLRCFGIIIEKGVDLNQDVAEHCYEQMCSRFNSYLQRLYLRESGPSTRHRHRGLLVVDESKYEGLFQKLSAEYRVNGTKWGNLRNLAEVPLFASSEASRLIQLADMVSYALWQRYERDEDQYFKTFVSAFDYSDSIYHGIYHKRLASSECECPGCATRARRR